jgi:hypothetical protein
MRADIVPGGTFPDYELTDHTKTRRENWEAGDHSMHHPYQAEPGHSPSAADSPSAAAVPGGA